MALRSRYRSLGIGSDFDGIDCVPVGLEDVSKFPNLTRALLQHGYTAEDIRKIYGENFLRVMRAVPACPVMTILAPRGTLSTGWYQAASLPRWRICFTWTESGPADVEIVDYIGDDQHA